MRLPLTLLLFPRRVFFLMLKEAVSIGKGFVCVKLKVCACYAWVQGREEWWREAWTFNVLKGLSLSVRFLPHVSTRGTLRCGSPSRCQHRRPPIIALSLLDSDSISGRTANSDSRCFAGTKITMVKHRLSRGNNIRWNDSRKKKNPLNTW